ncbi:MAG: hypothetical protein HOW73_04095 [Polyangiaceae bacterium]|nr:hypothetical protein [Polyangiaceae bacterium]
MSDQSLNLIVTSAVIVTFAALVTVHVATLFGLTKQRQFVPALGSLVFPPLAPYCAFVRGMRVRATIWVAMAVLYVAAVLLGR